jgi:hypothetical protein
MIYGKAMRAGFFCLLSILLCLFVKPAGAGEYDFAIPEAETKPWELGGRVEFRHVLHRVDRNSARYKLSYYNREPGNYTTEWRPQLELRGSYKKGILRAQMLTHHEYASVYREEEWTNKIYECSVSLKPSAGLTLEAGKKSILWGKGYAWNPAGFLNRPKDPDDAGLNLEGFTSIGADFIKTFSSGRLSNLAVTGLILPVLEGIGNSTLGERGDFIHALKIYLLWYDTDMDFIFMNGPSQPESYGFDFSKNLAENFEIHGEAALRRGARRPVIDGTGRRTISEENQYSWLLGIRYLTATDVTFILEYYKNGAGYNRDELEDFFKYQHQSYQGWLSTGDAGIVKRADSITKSYYGQRNFGRDYLYLKMSVREPFDILYFTPWLAVVFNTRDKSFNLQPGMTYIPITNMELNCRVGIPIGSSHTEFGEKPDVVRPEIWIRYYF